MSYKKLVNNLSANFAVQIVNLGFPLLLQFYLERTLDLADLGKWYVITASIALAQLLISFTHLHLVKEVAKDKSRQLIGSAYIISYLLSVIIFPIFLYNIISTMDLGIDLALFTVIYFLTLPLASAFYFQGKLKNAIVLKRKLIVKIGYVVFVLFLVQDKGDFSIFFLIRIVSYSVEHLFNFFYLLKSKVKIDYSMEVCKDIMSNSWAYIPFNASYNTLPHISILIFSKFTSPEILAIYSIFMRIVNVTTTFITSSVTVLLPYTISKEGSSITFLKGLFIKLGFSAITVVVILLLESYVLRFFLSRDIDYGLVVEFRFLLIYILFHVVYNYIVFLKFISKSILIVPISLNLTQIFIFMTIVTIGFVYGMSNFYSISVVLSSLLSIASLFIYLKFNRFVK